jgi:hypothetical protein
MAAVEAFKRGDEVLSKYPDGSILTVLAVEGLKVCCADSTKHPALVRCNYARTI